MGLSFLTFVTMNLFRHPACSIVFITYFIISMCVVSPIVEALTKSCRVNLPGVHVPKRAFFLCSANGADDLEIEYSGDNMGQNRSKIFRKAANRNDVKGTELGLNLNSFVPLFVGVWAIGYGILFLRETVGGGMGDSGGMVAVGLVVILMTSLFVATIYESFKEN